uniref:Uncharacterized protein n=1 Tax=Magallana gigas TaxID=29159 RepID=A0A8W8KMM8_MAGGI
MRGEVKSSHAMFPVVCQKFVHAMGPDTMIPAQSMDAAQDLDLLKVVLRKTKRSYLFWEKVKHTVLDFHLQSLLQNSHVVLDVPSKTKEFCQFNPETKYSLDGKLGIQLMRELMDASLSASDSVTISSRLGTIQEKSLDSEALLEALKGRRLDMTNTVVRQVVESTQQSISLCLVKDLYLVQKDAEIKRVKTVDEDLDVNEKVKVVPGDIDEKVHYDKTVTMSESERGSLIGALKTVMGNQAEIKRIENLLSDVEAESLKEASYSEWIKNGSFEETVYNTILTACGFVIKDDQLQYPLAPSSVLTACAYVFGALDEFDKRELQQLLSCDKEAGISLIEICSQAISGETAIVLPDFPKVLTKGTVGRDLAESLGFQLNDDKNAITSPSQITKTLENSYWVLYALFK